MHPSGWPASSCLKWRSRTSSKTHTGILRDIRRLAASHERDNFNKEARDEVSSRDEDGCMSYVIGDNMAIGLRA